MYILYVYAYTQYTCIHTHNNNNNNNNHPQTNQPTTTKRENIFISNVSAARNEALKYRASVKSWYAAMTMVARAVPIVVSLVGFGLYDVVFPGQLTAGKIFPSSP